MFLQRIFDLLSNIREEIFHNFVNYVKWDRWTCRAFPFIQWLFPIYFQTIKFPKIMIVHKFDLKHSKEWM